MMKRHVCPWKISSRCLRELWKCCSTLLPPSVGSAPILPEDFRVEPELPSDFLRPLGKQENIWVSCFSFLPPQLLQPVLFCTENIVRLNEPSYILDVDPVSQDWLYVFCNSRLAKSCGLVNWIKFMMEWISEPISEFILMLFSCKYIIYLFLVDKN